MLQRQILFKQLQAMQQRQQLQELNDARQQHYLNQLAFLSKQTSVNGMPIQDASQMFMGGNVHLSQRGTMHIVQGLPNGYVFSQAQNQPIYSMGGLPQQLDTSLYGVPVANSGDDMNSYSHIQGVSHDSANVMNLGNSQLEMPSILNNSFVNEQFNLSLDKGCMTDGAFFPKSSGDKNFYGQLLMQATEDGVQPANFQQPDSLQKIASLKVSIMGQEEAGWPLQSVEKTSRIGHSHNTASLDPLEEKILFNTDGSSWESSVGQHGNVDTGGFASDRQHVDFLGSFSANHSGSWSALMQSAVAEASSSDTGQQEEWSGLTFQNPEISTDNDHANYIGNGQQHGWVDNNMQNISSPPSNPEVIFQHSDMNYSFPTFQEADQQIVKQKEGMLSDFLHESIQQPQKNVKWFDCNSSQQKLPVDGCQVVQTSSQLQNVWKDRHPEHSKNDMSQPNISSYAFGSQPSNSLAVSLSGHELKTNVWRHESEPHHMAGGSCTPADQVNSPDTVSSSQIPQVENHSDNLYESSASQGIQTRMVPPSQEIPRSSYSSLLQAHLNVTNTSEPWCYKNELLYQQNSDAFVGNQSGCATSSLAASYGSQAKFATSPESCLFLRPSVEDSKPSNKENFSGIGYEQYKQNCFQARHNTREVNACEDTLQGYDQKEDQVGQLNSSKASTFFPLNRSIHGHGAGTNNLSLANAATAVSTSLHQQGFDRGEQRDNNAFDRYVGSHSLLQHFSLLQQVSANARQQLLFKLQSGVRNVTQGYGNMNAQLSSISHGESKPITFSSGSGGNLSGNHSSEDFIHGVGGLQSGETGKTDTHNVQVDPSWFKQSGAVKNGQMLAFSDSMHACNSKELSNGKSETSKVIDSIGQEDSSNAIQVRSILPNLDMENVIAAAQLLGDNEQNLALSRPKKRKVAALDILPWHKEVTQSSQPVHKYSSMGESEWALSSNRLSEKVEDGAEKMLDVQPISQAKKRLALTTKLMQHVFRPAPAVILSADASSNCESVVYFVARLALGDACSLTSGSHELTFNNDMSAEAHGKSERVGLLDFAKAVENFNSRAKRLENELLRMNKTASIVEMKVDSQELEKFCVINRFAKFHSKGHSGSTASGAAKPVPQRYVVAHPMPRVVPDGMNCISL